MIENLKTCRCNCGYRCGGPGRCKDIKCLWTEGHFVKDCGHKWDGPTQVHWSEHPTTGKPYESGGSVTCSTCGIDAMSHDCAVGP